jgi:VCBS repeat-containing protein
LVFADGVKLLVPDRAPQAVNDKAFTAADTATDIDVRANDSDPDGDPLRIASLSDADPTAPGVQSAMGATISIVNGQVHYDPTTSQVLQAVPHFHTVDDSFTYTVDDGFGGSATAMVDVIVAGLNHPPASGFLRLPPINQYQTIDINVAGVATDPDGDFVSVILPFDADPYTPGIQTEKGATRPTPAASTIANASASFRPVYAGPLPYFDRPPASNPA